MILTCPACETRFRVPPTAIGEAGRKVKCAKCGHDWHQMPIEDAPAAAAPAVPPAAAEGDSLADEDRRSELAQAFEDPDLLEAEAEDDEAGDDDEAGAASRTVRASRRARARAAREAAGDEDDEGRRGGWVGWLILLGVLAGIATAGYLYQQQIVGFWPPAGKLYHLAGLTADAGKSALTEKPAEPEGFGLAIRDVRWEHLTEKGRPVLLIKGEVVNTTDQARSVPRLRAAISDDRGRELSHWTVTTPISDLPAGKSTPFSTRLFSPPDGARSLAVTFMVRQ